MIAMVIGLAAALTLAILIILIHQRPDLYNPVRSALVEAHLHLVRAYGHERELLQQLREGERELDMALEYLGRVEHLDPALQGQIEPLRARLRTLQDDAVLDQLTINALHRNYQEMYAQVQALICAQH